MVSPHRSVPRRRQSESGLTLIELLVSLVILSIISGAIFGVLAVGFKVVAPGGPRDRLFGAHDLMILEEDLGRDGARAACIQLPGGSNYGSCGAGYTAAAAQDCSAANLCFGWPEANGTTWSCTVAAYTVGTGVAAGRTQATATGISSTNQLAREVGVTIVVGPLASIGFDSNQWVRSLPVQITAVGILNAPSQTLSLHPVATDPGSAENVITDTGSPC